jgi:DNA/RNA-binding domain of Phe-tRNA-synthetase-like protein
MVGEDMPAQRVGGGRPRYPVVVSEIDKHLRRIDARDAELSAIDAGASREAALLLRGVKDRLRSERQRELADELADEFEARAVQRSPSRSS